MRRKKIKNIIKKKYEFKNIEIQSFNFRFDHALRLEKTVGSCFQVFSKQFSFFQFWNLSSYVNTEFMTAQIRSHIQNKKRSIWVPTQRTQKLAFTPPHINYQKDIFSLNLKVLFSKEKFKIKSRHGFYY